MSTKTATFHIDTSSITIVVSENGEEKEIFISESPDDVQTALMDSFSQLGFDVSVY